MSAALVPMATLMMEVLAAYLLIPVLLEPTTARKLSTVSTIKLENSTVR